jgi:hypothetical protein
MGNRDESLYECEQEPKAAMAKIAELTALRAENNADNMALRAKLDAANARAQKAESDLAAALADAACQKRKSDDRLARIAQLEASKQQHELAWRSGHGSAEMRCCELSDSLAANPEPPRASLGHPGADEVFERLQAQRGVERLKPRTIALDDDPVEAADKAVLDAIRALTEDDLRHRSSKAAGLVFEAELARREALAHPGSDEVLHVEDGHDAR